MSYQSGDDFWRDVAAPTPTSHKIPVSFFPASMRRLATPIESRTAVGAPTPPEPDLNVSSINLAATELVSEPTADSDFKSITVEHQPIKSELPVPIPETVVVKDENIVEQTPIEVTIHNEVRFFSSHF
jgi:hypothetical protein